MNELLVIDEMQLKPKIVNEAQIEFDEKGINLIIERFESKYSNVVIRLEDEKEFEEDNKKIKKAIEVISRYRIDTEKEIKKPIDNFVSKYKEVEKRLKLLSENISIQLNEFKENLFNERIEIMKEIKKRIIKELEIEHLNKLIEIPEQKGQLARSSFTELKAEKMIRENAEDIMKQYKNLKRLVELEAVKNNINLNADDYILIMDNEEEVKSRIDFQIRAINENEERIKRQEQERIEKEIEEEKLNRKVEQVIEDVKEEAKKVYNNKKILEIDLSKIDREKQKLLKQFLDKFEIGYEVKTI
ncbi:DUF1351 domain-containing protein [Streptobacillus moniliformis]|uniref:DUF1351 domain-containing protein n=1 Tax=Streptobacillus moniliformis TaxID=34105 RepID=UPI0007E3EC26|nr:DUF1351 domain-containing protein [Streptobacillus moniliformis]